MRTSIPILLMASAPCLAHGTELYAAGSSVFRVDVTAGTVLARGPIQGEATDVVADPRGRYVAVSTSEGLTMLAPSTLEVTARAPLGVIDAIEASTTGDTLYALLHPGSDRRAPSGSHRLLAIAHDDLARSWEIAALGSSSYDLFRTPLGDRLVVTRLVGRTLDVVQVATGSVVTLEVDDGRDRNTLAVLRALAFTGRATEMIVGESARGRPLVLWSIDLEGGAIERRATIWPMHASDVLVTPGGVVVNGRDQIGWLTGALVPIRRGDLPRDAWHAVADADGTIYLAAPAQDGARILALRSPEDAPDEVVELPERVVRLAQSASSAPGRNGAP